jgi:histidinol-phosphate phosphatase family protein
MDIENLPVAILAGGLATRLKPLTERIPKALVEVAGRPFVDWQLEALAAQGVGRVVFCVGHLGEMVEAHVGNGGRFGLGVSYSHDGPVLLGTGGALKRALPLLGGEFLVLYGDSFLRVDFGAVARRFRECGKPGLMTVMENAGRWDASNVLMEGGRLVRYDKAARLPEMRHIDYGLEAFRAEVFAGRGDGAFDLAEVMGDLVAAGGMDAMEVGERFYEIGSAQGIADMEAWLASRPKRPAVFFDRDGIINEVVMRDGVACSPRRAVDFRFKEGIHGLFGALKAVGCLRIIATNQPDVERGQIPQTEYEAMRRLVFSELRPDGFEACEASSNDNPRKKPNPGMLLDAAAKYAVDAGRSWFVGDTWKDMEAGRRAGVRAVLLETPYNADARALADFCFPTLAAIESFLLSQFSEFSRT